MQDVVDRRRVVGRQAEAQRDVDTEAQNDGDRQTPQRHFHFRCGPHHQPSMQLVAICVAAGRSLDMSLFLTFFDLLEK